MLGDTETQFILHEIIDGEKKLQTDILDSSALGADKMAMLVISPVVSYF